MNFMYKLERKFGRYAIKNLSLILILCYAAGYIIEFTNPNFLSYLTLDPYAIVHGQVWRIVSWIIVPPPNENIIFAIIMLIFYYSIGTTLERTWGTFQYNVYLFSGMIFTLIGSFLLMGYCYLFRGEELELISNGMDNGAALYFRSLSYSFSTYYVNMSIFLAFAATYPNEKVLLMFFIPIKVKVLGIIYGAFLVYEMIAGATMTAFGFVYPFAIGSSLLNFIVFFFTTRRYIHKSRSQKEFNKKINKIKREEKQAMYSGATKHKCALCGKTEKDGDNLVFRYCSKCNGSFEFCQDHIYTHIHKE